ASITPKALERTLDCGPLQRLQIEAVAQNTLVRLLCDLGRKFSEPYGGSTGDDHRTLDRMLELANVPGPTIIHQGGHRVRRHVLHVLFDANGRAPNEVVDQRRDVLAAIAQRRNSNDEGAETEIEVFAEGASVDGRPQIPVGGRHDAGVHFDGALRPHASNLTFLERP